MATDGTGRSVVVVGGGILGLTLALRLSERGHRVTVMEAAREIGGLATAHELPGPDGGAAITWDRFYHVTLLSDLRLRALLDEIGLGDQLRWGTTRTGFYTGGRLHPFSTSLDFLRFPPLSLIDKARLAATILYASRVADPLPLERETAASWLDRWSGRRTFERIWRPLLQAKLGENWDRANAAFIWATIARMYAARRTGLKREMFGYVDGGYARVLARLREVLETRGVVIRTGVPVHEVRESVDGADGATVTLASGERVQADAAILTVACGHVARICPQLTAAEAERLRSVTYQGIVCASIVLDHPLAGYYVTNITDAGLPFTAVIEMTALVDRQRFGGRTLVYLPRYLAQESDFWNRTDDEVRELFLGGLERMYPDFRRSHVRAFQVARVRDVMALPTLDYSRQLVPPIRTSLSRVFIVNSAQIAHGTLNVNETIAIAERQAVDIGQALEVPALASEAA